jgi:hypothetical protein
MASGTKKRIVWGVSITVGLVLLFGFVGPLIPYKQVRNWICPVSGSTRTEITWLGHFSHEERTATALEKWLRRKEPGFEPNWQHFSTQTYFVLGRSCATAGTPEIYQLSPILDRVVGKLSDKQIAALVAVLRVGSHDEQQHMIEKVSDEVFAGAAPADRNN